MNIRDALGIGDREFYRKLLTIAVPAVLQQIINTALYMADTVMIGALGDFPLAGVSAANQLAYIFDIFMFGIVGGAGVFMAQSWGRRDVPAVRSSLGLAFIFGGSFTLLIFALAQLFPTFIVSSFVSEDPSIAEGVDYLRIASFGYLLRALIYPLGSAQRSCGNAKLPMLTGAAALLVNIALNYVLIFGKLGAPALGVKGAAIATVIGASLDALLLFLVTYVKRTPAAARLRELMKQTREGLRAYIRVATPIVLDDGLWAVGLVAMSYIIGRMGDAPFAANTIVGTVDRLTFILLAGIGNASAVVLGNTLGEGGLERAHSYSKRFIVLAGLTGVVMAAVTLLWLVDVPDIYNVSPEIKRLARGCIAVLALFLPTSGVNYAVLVGILRAGGDTRYAAVVDLLPMFALSVPLAAIFGLWLNYDLIWVYFMCNIPASIVRFIFGVWRVRRGSWAQTL